MTVLKLTPPKHNTVMSNFTDKDLKMKLKNLYDTFKLAAVQVLWI